MEVKQSSSTRRAHYTVSQKAAHAMPITLSARKQHTPCPLHCQPESSTRHAHYTVSQKYSSLLFKIFPNSSKHQTTSLLQSVCDSVFSSMWCFARLLRSTCTCCMHLQCRDVEMFVVRIQKQSQLHNLYFFFEIRFPSWAAGRVQRCAGGAESPAVLLLPPKGGRRRALRPGWDW